MGSKKKKTKSKKKQFWGLPFDVRKENALEWMKTYEGESLVKDYSKRFGLNLKNSLKEIRKLGVSISCEELEKVKSILKAKEQQRKNKREKRKQQAFEKEYAEDYDDTFAFIAGYTEGGAPYGITYEEMEEFEERDCPF